TDIPVPKAGHVLIRVATTDGTPTNQGDDIAGYIEALGERVIGFHKGDRVAAYAEYTIAPDYITFYIPAKTRFKETWLEAATIPLATMTTTLGLYQRLKLPLP
ncbi:hypothetical protein N7499_004054, partial [Penicillium canescens]